MGIPQFQPGALWPAAHRGDGRPVTRRTGPGGAAPIAVSLTTYLLLYAVLLAAYVSVVFYLAANAALGNIPRERERLDNPMLAVGVS